MNRNSSFFAVESLLSLCKKLYNHFNADIIETDQYCIYQPTAEPSWYCRTHIWNNEPGREKELANFFGKLCREEKSPRLLSFTQEEVTSALPLALQAAGFSPYRRQMGMLIELPPDYSCHNNSNVIRVGSERIDEWAETCSASFDKPSMSKIMRTLVQDPTCLFYAYLQDGAIAATSITSLQPGNAGIHEVGTLQEYRGRGFCKALFTRSFVDAAKLGYHLVSLQASALGEPVYRSMGMQAVSQVVTYEYQA